MAKINGLQGAQTLCITSPDAIASRFNDPERSLFFAVTVSESWERRRGSAQRPLQTLARQLRSQQRTLGQLDRFAAVAKAGLSVFHREIRLIDLWPCRRVERGPGD